MASTYSTDLKIELMVTGENAGTWGDKTNDNLNVIQQAIAGYGEQSIAGGAQTTALTIANSPTLSVARNIVLKLTGTITGNQIVTVPSGIEKTWIVSNGTTGAFQVQFKTTDFGSSGTIWSTTDKGIKILYSNGTEIFPVDLSTLSGTVASASIANLAVTSAKLASFAVTEARLASYAVTASRLATNAVTAIKITQSTITQSKLAPDSVGSNQLINTAVTPGSYTSASITVDADGRITGASSGAAGGGAFQPIAYVTGSTSGTYTKTAGTNVVAGWFVSPGGGAGGSAYMGGGGGSGGSGAFGWYYQNIANTNTIPYSIAGAGGGGGGGMSNGNGNPGSGGGSLVFGNITWPGGNAGNGGPRFGTGSPGNPGTNTGFYFAPPTSNKGWGSSGGMESYGNGGYPQGMNCGSPGFGNPGSAGAFFLFENTGV